MWEKLQRSDFKRAMDYIENNSPFTCPIYGNAASAGFAYKPFTMRSGIYYVYKELGEIHGIVAGYNDGNVMVHTNNFKAEAALMQIIGEFPFHSVWGLSGNLPGLMQVSNATEKDFDSRTLDVMVLKDKINVSFRPECGLLRVDKRFLSTVYVSFIKKCLWEGFGFKSSSMDIRKRMKERSEIEPYWFLTDGDEYVAQAHVQAMTAEHGYIGGVCTPRKYRKKGYAKEIVKRVSDYIIKKGRVPSLAVSEKNKAAVALYEGLGFETVGKTLVYMLERDFKGDENSD